MAFRFLRTGSLVADSLLRPQHLKLDCSLRPCRRRGCWKGFRGYWSDGTGLLSTVTCSWSADGQCCLEDGFPDRTWVAGGGCWQGCLVLSPLPLPPGLQEVRASPCTPRQVCFSLEPYARLLASLDWRLQTMSRSKVFLP